MKKIFKSIYQFFLTIYIFKSYTKFGKINKKGASIFFIKYLNEVKVNKIMKKYFEKNEYKLDRFGKKSNRSFGFKAAVFSNNTIRTIRLTRFANISPV